jgi:hypothetical protein
MASETSYLKPLKFSQFFRLVYYKIKAVSFFFWGSVSGQKKVFLKPSSKTLRGLMLLKDQQIYKRKSWVLFKDE